MSKLRDYTVRQRTKNRVLPALGTGVGMTYKDNSRFEAKKWVFVLKNPSVSGTEAEQEAQVTLFKEQESIFILDDQASILGEVPPATAQRILLLLQQGVRFKGQVSAIKKMEGKLLIEVTLEVKK